MKILVFSDSHGASSKIVRAINMHGAKCDAVIFLGDGLRDIEYVKSLFPELCFFCVSGNCDMFSGDTPTEALLDFDGIKIFVTHGHRYFVKHGYGTLADYAHSKGADAAFFGHTHVPLENCEYLDEKRVTLFNPGSIGMGSYGVINTVNGVLVTSIGSV